MADYAASVFAKAQSMLSADFQSPEMRVKPSSALSILAQNTQFTIPDIKNLKAREDHPTKTYLKNRASRALTSARAYNHTGAVADSTEVDIAFTSYVDKFATSLKRGDNNVINDAEILKHEIQNSISNLHEGIETALVTFLQTGRNQNGTAAKRVTFSALNDTYEIAANDADEFWHIIKSIYRQEKYSVSQFDVLSDSLLSSTGEFKSQQGQGNSTNLGFQFSGLDVRESIELADVNYANGVVLAAPKMTTGIIDWIPKQNRVGKGNFDSVLGGYSSMMDPFGTGITFAVHAYTERADTSASNGNAQDEVTQWEISVDLSPQIAPMSTAGDSPVFQIAQL